jgi:hypothetical protein
LYNLFTLYRKKRIGTDQSPIRVQLCDSRKGKQEEKEEEKQDYYVRERSFGALAKI